MGVNYHHYLIPRDNTLRPEPDRIVALIEAWVDKGFIPRPDSVAADKQHGSSGARPEAGPHFATEASDTTYIQYLRERASKPRGGFWARLWGRGESPQSSSPRPDSWMPFSVPPTGESLAALAGPYTRIRWVVDPHATHPLQGSYRKRRLTLSP